MFGGDIYGISGASAGEYTEFKLHNFRLSFKTTSIDKLAHSWNIIVRLPAQLEACALIWSEYARVYGRDGLYTRDENAAGAFAATLSIDGDTANVFDGFTTVGEAGA